MLSPRSRQIVGLLREGPRSGAELADALGVSRRTVVRDVAQLNDLLLSVGAGSIESEPSYHLIVSSERALVSLVSGGLTDAERVLVAVLTSPAPNLSQLSADTYLSRRAVQRAISEINESYGSIVRVEAHVGQGVVARFASASPIDFAAALAIENHELAAEFGRVSDWEGMHQLLTTQTSEYLSRVVPYVTPRQARIQELCSIACAPSIDGGADGWSVARGKAVREFQAAKVRLLSELIRQRPEIVKLVMRLLSSHGISPTRDDLASLIFDHIVRCSMFPTLMSAEMRGQMREMRMKHPFEFDFGAELCDQLRRFNPHLLMEADYLSLYVLASIESYDDDAVRLLLLCRRHSVAAINKYLIGQVAETADIRVVDSEEAAFEALCEEPGFDLVVGDVLPGDGTRSEGVLHRDLIYQGVLSSASVERVRKLICKVAYEKGIASMLPQSSFVDVAGGRSYFEALRDGLDVLVERGVLTEHEAYLVVNREEKGERLHFGGVAFPHAITPEPSRTFRLFAISPDAPLDDEGESVGFVLVVLASHQQVDKSSIFSYLFTTLVGVDERVRTLPTSWQEAVEFFGGRMARG